MANYAVDPGTMDDGVQRLRGITAKLEESLAALMAAAERFKAANAGQAIDGYDEAQQLWSQGMSEMKEALGGRATSLVRIGGNYVDGDVRGASLFAR